MKYFLFILLIIKNYLENNLFNLQHLKKINYLNFRQTDDSIYFNNINIIFIKVFSKYSESKDIKYIYDFHCDDILIYKNGSSYGKIKTVNMNPGEYLIITLHYPSYFLKSCDYMFYEITDVVEIIFKNFKGCTNAYNMFNSCSSLKILNLSSFDASKIISMKNMFSYCKSLEVLDVTSFNTSSLKILFGTFSYCSKLKSLNLSSFDTSLVYDMDNIFEGSLNLNLLILSNKFTMENLTL